MKNKDNDINTVALRDEVDIQKIKFPSRDKKLDEESSSKIEKTILENTIIINCVDCYIEKDSLTVVLATDKKGVNRFYNNLETEQKIENGDNKFVSYPAVNEKLSEKIMTQPDFDKLFKLRHAEKCLNTIRDNDELVIARGRQKEIDHKEIRGLKDKKIKDQNITCCQLTGEPLQKNAAAHHIERQADSPRKAKDLNNVIVVNPKPHEIIHNKGAESKIELEDLCKKEKWNIPKEIKNK